MQSSANTLVHAHKFSVGSCEWPDPYIRCTFRPANLCLRVSSPVQKHGCAMQTMAPMERLYQALQDRRLRPAHTMWSPQHQTATAAPLLYTHTCLVCTASAGITTTTAEGEKTPVAVDGGSRDCTHWIAQRMKGHVAVRSVLGR